MSTATTVMIPSMSPAVERARQRLAFLQKQQQQPQPPSHPLWGTSTPSSHTPMVDWQTLPSRVRALCRRCHHPASHEEEEEDHPMMEQDNKDQNSTINRKDNDGSTWSAVQRLTTTDDDGSILTLTADVMATATQDNFFHPFRTLFCALIDHNTLQSTTTSDTEEDESMNDHENTPTKDHNDQEDELFLHPASTRTLFQDLIALQWLVPHQQRGLLWRTFEQGLHECIQRKISTALEQEEDLEQEDDYASSGITTTLYDELLGWTKDILWNWIQKDVLATGPTTTIPTSHHLFTRLVQTTADCFGRLRIARIFDIVADYPDSLPAVRDLQRVVAVVDPTTATSSSTSTSTSTQHLQAHLATTLQQALHRRLCHPGASTHQIIQVYVNTIKVLRVIDPSDRLLTAVTQPVRRYLRGRSDTIRCIIESLTASASSGASTTSSSDLYHELRRQDAKPLEDVTADSDDEDEGPPSADDWMPPPSIHQPRGSFLQASRIDNHNATTDGTEGDILAMLVSIYGSKELFVNEYRVMLADKLLANLEYNVDQEVHTLELLKLRFGELSMRSCEVMLKDLNDSKRTNTNVRETLEAHADSIVDAVMVSHIFWPSLHEQALKHHPRLQYMLEVFAKEYARLKNPRVLLWFPQLGTVDLEAEVVEQDGRTVVKNFTCSPLLATLLAHFEDKPAWTATDLSNETSLPEHTIQKRMAYWVSQKVLRLVPPRTVGNNRDKPLYVLASVDYLASTDGDADHHHAYHQAHDHEVAGVSMAAQEEEEMDVYLSYIVGMLTNLGSLPLKTIHNNLKTFVTGSDLRYNKTPQQLGAFLQRLCKEERLEVGPDGMYKLFKK